MNLKKEKIAHKKKEEGFTLVEVIAVLVILGILAAVAVPKFFDMQATARTKALEGAVGELNGQVALAFAQNALNGGAAGLYEGFTGYVGPDFTVTIGANPVSGPATADVTPDTGTIAILTQAAVPLTFTAGSTDAPGYFAL